MSETEAVAVTDANASRQLQPGDLVTPDGMAAPYGAVFDVVGDVVRVWWNGAQDHAVNELSPHSAAGLRFVRRPQACLTVTYDDGVKSYSFVATADRLYALERAAASYDRAEHYTVIFRRFGLEDGAGTGDG